MAHRCNASAADPWVSTINQTMDDGTITINPEGGNGRFDGTHRRPNPPNRPLAGRCFEAGGGLPDRIWFFVEATNQLYFGVIHASGRRIDGTRFTFTGASPNLVLSSDDDWVGTKT